MKLSLIPRPMVTDIFEEEESGILSISENFAITPAKKLEKYVLLIQRDILDILNMDVHIKKDDSTENLFININPAEFIEAQSYRIVIDENGIELCGADETGLFYAIQTFKQLLLIYGKNLQYMEIEDEPGYSWRGLHIDVSRHFFPISFLKKIVNMMALLKLNRFHWHLTDDQGWRIESFKFPNLHETGSCRNEEGQQKAQYYTQAEIRDFVKYAEERFIEVVPEIDMPGHTQAMLASYPHLSCSGEVVQVWDKWGVSEQVLCLGKESTYQFVEELLEEVIPLFSSPYFHIGGDECPETEWIKCPHCQKKIEELGLDRFRSLQHHFTHFLGKILKKHSKQLIGWDEIIEGELPDNAIVMSWRGDAIDGALFAMKQNRPVIFTPNTSYYFDWKQTILADEQGAFGVTSLKRVFDYKPLKMLLQKTDIISEQLEELIMGIQANVWTEYIHNEKELEYMLYPRLLAIAEQAWQKGNNEDFEEFHKRVNTFKSEVTDFYEVNYCKKV